jgi:hypothetical protein
MPSGGGFVPVGSVLQRQHAVPPARRALPAPADSARMRSGSSKDWQPLLEFVEIEERVNDMFRNRTDGTPGGANRIIPPNDKKR